MIDWKNFNWKEALPSATILLVGLYISAFCIKFGESIYYGYPLTLFTFDATDLLTYTLKPLFWISFVIGLPALTIPFIPRQKLESLSINALLNLASTINAVNISIFFIINQYNLFPNYFLMLLIGIIYTYSFYFCIFILSKIVNSISLIYSFFSFIVLFIFIGFTYLNANSINHLINEHGYVVMSNYGSDRILLKCINGINFYSVSSEEDLRNLFDFNFPKQSWKFPSCSELP